MTDRTHICVCLCTFRRPEYLKRLLVALDKQETGGVFTYSVVVGDNDAAESARPVIEEFARTSPLAVTYCVESRQNIALARNKTLAQATGDFVAFVDDDEFPVPEWLPNLLRACEQYKADGVLGPVRPHFENPPPGWIIKGRFCERLEHPTGTRIGWAEGRTGNLLIRRSLVENAAEPFDPQFGNGGEDRDFFVRMDRAGRIFVWCNEAVIYETVPPARCTRGYMLKRALLRGKNNLKLSTGRTRLLLTSLIAVPLYSIALPVLLLFGQHRFMRYCIKLCDHAGRLLAVAGINPINER